MSNDTPQDARIRALMVELSESSPLAPTAEELGLTTQTLAADDSSALPAYTEVSSMVVKENPKGRKIFGGLAAAAAMLVGGSVAFNAATNDGRATPEAAVEQLLDAMAEEDALGMIESIDPDERGALTPHIDDIVAELERVELLSGVDTNAVAGFDFRHEDVVLDSRQLGEGVWAVGLVDGSFASTTDPAALPLVSGLSDTNEVGGFASDLDEWVASWPELFAGNNFEMVVTNDDGWHVNVLYTLMEAIRKTEGWPVPDYSAPLAPAGAETPEAAVEGWIEAQGAWDVRSIVDLLDPVEMPAVHRYVAQLEEVFRPAEFGIAGSETTLDEVRVEGEGSERTVVIERFTTTQRYEDFDNPGGEDVFTLTTSFDGQCRVTDSPSESEGLNGASICIDDDEIDAPTRGVLVATPIEMRVVERDGAWFVSPVGTVVDQALDMLRSRNRDGFDSDTVFFSLFEIPLLPVYSPGGATGLVAFDDGFSDAFEACDQPMGGELRTEEEATRLAEELRTCLVDNGLNPQNVGPTVAMTACSYVWNFESPVMELAEALTISEDYEACVLEQGGDPGTASIVGDFFCSGGFSQPDEDFSEEEFSACLEQFGIDRPLAPAIDVSPVEVPEGCESAFDAAGQANTEEEFNQVVAASPECFPELPGN